MSNVDNNSKALKSWQLLIIGIIGLLAGVAVGGNIGALITIFLGHLIIIFALIAFIKERIGASKASRKE